MLALSTNTWHAYNDFGGPNLYTGGTHVAMQRPMAAGYLYKPPGKGRRVTGTGAPDPQNAAHVGYIQINHLSGYAGSAGWPDWELPFVQWAEHEGFEIGVCTNADLEEHPEVLEGASLYLSVGHDEYWSRGMRDTVEAFVAGGGNAAFFSGNTSLWQVRIEGDDHDVMVGYKAFFKSDPLMGTDLRAGGDDVLVRCRRRPAREHHDGRLVHPRGLSPHRSECDRRPRRLHGAPGRPLDLRRHRARVRRRARCAGAPSWATSATGASSPTGTGCPTRPARTARRRPSRSSAHAPRSTSRGRRRPARPSRASRASWSTSRPAFSGRVDPEGIERIRHGHAVLGAYTNEAGATVLTSGSTDWAHGLAGRDPQIEQITRNVLTRLGPP